MEKLKVAEAQCKAANSKIDSRLFVADFSKDACNMGLYHKLANDLTDFDISVLVNNVGVASVGYFKDITHESIRDMAIVNTYPYVLLTCALLPTLMKAPKSLIVNLASSASFQPGPYQGIYSCTKVFDRFYSEALQSELQSKGVEVLTVCPMYVETNMTQNMKDKSSTITCEDYCQRLHEAMANPTPVGVLVGPPLHYR
jgi:short-subunit dehydrogenase